MAADVKSGEELEIGPVLLQKLAEEGGSTLLRLGEALLKL